MSNLANTLFQAPGAKPNGVVVSTSIDGGQHFINSFLANDLLFPECMGNAVDQPSLAADPLVANRYFVAWRFRGTDLGRYGACGISFDVNTDTGAIQWWTSVPIAIDVHPQLGEGVGGLIVQARNREITVVYADTSAPARGCIGPISITWKSSTSFDRGLTWTREAVIDTDLFRTCLPDSDTGVIQPGQRNFGFVRDLSGTLWAAISEDDNLGFKIFNSTNVGNTWQFRTTVQVGSGAYSFFPALAADDRGRIGMSMQVLGETSTGGAGVTTWFAALEPGATAFIGPVPISGGYVANNVPAEGPCFHSLCTVGGGLTNGCDPGGCTTQVCATPGFSSCCDTLLGTWDRNCVDLIGNAPFGAPVCSGFTCGGRTLGDFAGQASIATGNIVGNGIAGTFMPAWTQGSVAAGGGGFTATVTAATVQVSP